MNRYPLWKYLLILFVVVVGTIYALPNLYGDSPAVQVSSVSALPVGDDFADAVTGILDQEALPWRDTRTDGSRLLVRFSDADTQLRAADVLRRQLGDGYTVALNLATNTPAWLRTLGALPMVLGLDLQGGVHFLMQVDMETARNQQIDRYLDDIRTTLRQERIRYKTARRERDQIVIELRSAEDRNKSLDVLSSQLADLDLTTGGGDGADLVLRAAVKETAVEELRKNAVEQNVITLRNRVNALGVAEPVIQRQGADRIVVQLPGVQDTAEAKRILGATATLEYRAVDEQNDAYTAQQTGRIPPDSLLFLDRGGIPYLLKRQLIVSGDQLIGASSGFDPTTGSPSVSVTLDGVGAKRMLDFTLDNVGNRMAVVFIEYKPVTREEDGKTIHTTVKEERIISVAVVREPFGKRFQTTGLNSPEEARQLALLLRAGALVAPVNIIEERTVGPSLGQDNIDQGFRSVIIGFLVVLVFVSMYYKVFGLFASLALSINLVLLVAVLSMFGATLTLPGIAGIVLTVGMAVDANVLIFERIREEVRNGNTPQNAIRAGYDNALSTIVDANVTTFIAALALFLFGTGPIKGFAVTLSFGILTSMFSAIMVTRALVNLTYGRVARLKSLAV